MTLVEADPKAPFLILTASRCTGGRYSISWIAPLTLDPCLIILSVKQGGIKYHFLSLWYDSTWDCTSVSWNIGKHSTHYTNGQVVLNNPHRLICHKTQPNYNLLLLYITRNLKNQNPIIRWFGKGFGLVWFLCLMAYQLFLGYLMPKPFS